MAFVCLSVCKITEKLWMEFADIMEDLVPTYNVHHRNKLLIHLNIPH